MGSYPAWPKTGSAQCSGETVCKPGKAFQPQVETLGSTFWEEARDAGKKKSWIRPPGHFNLQLLSACHNTKDETHLKSVTWGRDAGRDSLCFVSLFRVSCYGFIVLFCFAPPLVWLAKATIWKPGDSPDLIAQPTFMSPINKHSDGFLKSPSPSNQFPSAVSLKPGLLHFQRFPGLDLHDTVPIHCKVLPCSTVPSSPLHLIPVCRRPYESSKTQIWFCHISTEKPSVSPCTT